MTDEASFPYYFQVAETILRRVREGEYQPGDTLPSAQILEKDFGVSDITIRKALHLLVQRGVVVRKRGIGTLIMKGEDNRATFDIKGDFLDLTNVATGKPIKYEVEVIDISLTLSCPKSIKEILLLGSDDEVWRMRRIRKKNGEPISYFTNYGPPELFKSLEKRHLQEHSFVELAEKRCGIRFGRFEQSVEATSADIDLSLLLAISFGTPLFFVVNTYYSTKNQPVAVTHTYFRGDRYKYRASIKFP